MLLALAFGALLLGAGVLLFVSAHWDELSPAGRMSLVVLLVAGFHIAGALTAGRFEGMSIALHTVGTISLGAGIALTGQIYHLSSHWPAGIMLWSAGAVVGWLLLRHWTQAVMAALLIPFWLGGEWWEAMGHLSINDEAPILYGMFFLALSYLTARSGDDDSALRRALTWIGAIGILPAGVALFAGHFPMNEPGWEYQIVGWTLALGLPLALSVLLRHGRAIFNAAAISWVMTLWQVDSDLFRYIWFALFAAGIIAWGVSEKRIERINIGIAGFALLLLGFYFSSVMDKLGRSASLIGLGILFLAGGWLLERTRRRLVARIQPEST